jgi:hypothetical protein
VFTDWRTSGYLAILAGVRAIPNHSEEKWIEIAELNIELRCAARGEEPIWAPRPAVAEATVSEVVRAYEVLSRYSGWFERSDRWNSLGLLEEEMTKERN